MVTLPADETDGLPAAIKTPPILPVPETAFGVAALLKPLIVIFPTAEMDAPL